MGISRKSIARIVLTAVTLALLAKAIAAIWSFVAAARSTYERFQVTLSEFTRSVLVLRLSSK